MKPCCCDDFCESVKTTLNRFSAFTWGCDFLAPFCENSGNQGVSGGCPDLSLVSSSSFNRFRASFSILLHRIRSEVRCKESRKSARKRKRGPTGTGRAPKTLEKQFPRATAMHPSAA